MGQLSTIQSILCWISSCPMLIMYWLDFVLLAYYLMKAVISSFRLLRLHDHLLNPGFEETGLEPLHFAFKASVGTHLSLLLR